MKPETKEKLANTFVVGLLTLMCLAVLALIIAAVVTQ